MSDTTTRSDTAPPASTSDPNQRVALPQTRRRRSKRLWFVFALLGAALAFLLFEGLGSSLNYFDTVDQALAHRATLGTITFRLEGTVVPGSIRATARGTDFAIAQGPHVLHVSNTGTPPQLFGPRIPVVVIGHFTTNTSFNFVSNGILVKHSPDYVAKYPGRVTAPNGSVR